MRVVGLVSASDTATIRQNGNNLLGNYPLGSNVFFCLRPMAHTRSPYGMVHDEHAE